MLKLVVASCLASAALGQYNIEPEKAKILKEQRFNAGDGRFGSAYAQEDGTVYREETSADGERVGQYSYIDNDGKTITVRYSAGKDGFRILEGDHVPTGANGLNSAAYQPVQNRQQQSFAPAPAPQQQSQQRFQSQQQAPASADYEYYDDLSPSTNNFVQPQQNFAPATAAPRRFSAPAPQQQAANVNPFINPHDPTHRNFQFNKNGANFGGGNQFRASHSPSSVPPCADCSGVNPFINPYDASHRNPQAFGVGQVGQARPTQAPFRQQQQQQFRQPQQFSAPAPTQAPRNFFPPGQLQLNRFENGFNFDFTSQ